MIDKILSHIDEQETLRLAIGLTRHQSFSGQEKGAADYLAGEMKRMGFEVDLIDSEKNRPNVVGRIRGDGRGPSFIFNGHLDVDPVMADYNKDPWNIRVEGRRLHGHGLRNMKAGVAAMVMAAASIRKAGVALRGDVLVAAVVGELQGGIGTVDLIKQGVMAEYGVVPEPTLLHIRTVHAGMCQFLVHTVGKACWAGSLHKYKSINAVEKMYKAMRALQEMKLTCSPRPDLPELPRKVTTNIIGGFSRNYTMWRPSYIPDFCTLIFEVRTVPGQTVQVIEADMRQALDRVKREDPDFQYEIEPPPAAYREPWRGNKWPMPALDLPVDHELVSVVRRHHQTVTGQDVPGIGFYDPGSYAGADSGHLFEAGCDCLNYGPTGHGLAESSVDIDMMMTCTKVLALTAAEITTRTKE